MVLSYYFFDIKNLDKKLIRTIPINKPKIAKDVAVILETMCHVPT